MDDILEKLTQIGQQFMIGCSALILIGLMCCLCLGIHNDVILTIFLAICLILIGRAMQWVVKFIEKQNEHA